MIEYGIVAIVVGAVAFLTLRSLFRTFTGKAAGCGCGVDRSCAGACPGACRCASTATVGMENGRDGNQTIPTH